MKTESVQNYIEMLFDRQLSPEEIKSLNNYNSLTNKLRPTIRLTPPVNIFLAQRLDLTRIKIEMEYIKKNFLKQEKIEKTEKEDTDFCAVLSTINNFLNATEKMDLLLEVIRIKSEEESI